MRLSLSRVSVHRARQGCGILNSAAGIAQRRSLGAPVPVGSLIVALAHSSSIDRVLTKTSSIAKLKLLETCNNAD